MRFKKESAQKKLSKPQREAREIKKTAIILNILLLGLVIAALNLNYGHIKGNLFGDWIEYKTTIGEIVGSKTVVGRRKSLKYEIKFRYTVNNQEYQSDLVNLAGRSSYNHEYARSMVRKYPWKSNVTVYYDVDSPSFAVLDPKVREPREAFFAIVICLFLVGMMAYVNYKVFTAKPKDTGPPGSKGRRKRKPKRQKPKRR